MQSIDHKLELLNSQKRNLIKTYLRDWITSYDWKRDYGKFAFKGFSNLDEFYEWNDDTIDIIPVEMLEFLFNLIGLINNRQVQNMDKESMVPFPLEGFYWNKKSKLVLFNGR